MFSNSKLYKAVNCTVIGAALFMLFATFVGCGGGGGGNSIFRGQWLGAWSDIGQSDTGLFSVSANGGGGFNGTANNDVCGSSGSASGSFGNNSTSLNMKFKENSVCYAYSVRASGDPMTPYQNGYASVVSAKYYDRNNKYLFTVDWGLYMERDNRSPDGVRLRVKELSPTNGRTADLDVLKKNTDAATPSYPETPIPPDTP